MRANDPNLPHLRQVAKALGDLRDHVVFVGGAVAGLLVTDPLADSVRATRDVDAVVNASRVLFHRIEATVAEFNRLVALATDRRLAVTAELRVQSMPDRPDRPILAVRVVAQL